jgi:hypothetical protein
MCKRLIVSLLCVIVSSCCQHMEPQVASEAQMEGVAQVQFV